MRSDCFPHELLFKEKNNMHYLRFLNKGHIFTSKTWTEMIKWDRVQFVSAIYYNHPNVSDINKLFNVKVITQKLH